jgi:cardiolipin synthase
VGSHISAVVRPFSTVFRLLSLVAYTGLDALRSTPSRDIPREPPPPVNDGPGMDLAVWEDRLDEITRSRASMGNMELLIGGEEFFPRLERTVADARSSVHLQIYIFDNDDYALDFGRLLKDRSREVEVKVLMDGLGTIMASGVDHKSLPESHTPPPSLSSYLRDGSRVKVRKLTNPWLTFDHTKSIVIDRRVAFVGGMNIGREYRHIWHDMMVQVEGPVVGTLQEGFTRTWDYAGVAGDLALLTSYRDRETPSTNRNLYPLRVLKTRIGHSQIYRAQIAAIRRAKKYIYIENPYLSDDVVLHELIMARHRGVDVRVILPRQCNWKTMRRSNVLAANEMLANGIRVYMFPGMSHVKAAVIDGWACLGSANLDKASFRFNREINLATSHPAFVDKLITRLFKADFDRSILLEEARPERPSDRILEMVADLM